MNEYKRIRRQQVSLVSANLGDVWLGRCEGMEVIFNRGEYPLLNGIFVVAIASCWLRQSTSTSCRISCWFQWFIRCLRKYTGRWQQNKCGNTSDQQEINGPESSQQFPKDKSSPWKRIENCIPTDNRPLSYVSSSPLFVLRQHSIHTASLQNRNSIGAEWL